MEIRVNGDARTVAVGITVSELLRQLEMQPRFVAVERNLELVPRTTHAQCVLQPGDCVEVVTLVGGG